MVERLWEVLAEVQEMEQLAATQAATTWTGDGSTDGNGSLPLNIGSMSSSEHFLTL